MKSCYKCRAPYFRDENPGFQEVCEKCGSYFHCCCNCRFYEELSRPSCREPTAEPVSDPNGMNHCEYFVFKSSRGMVDDLDDPEQKRMRRRPDWRNVRDKSPGPKSSRPKGGYASSGSEERARRARENLDQLFGGK